MEVTAMLSRSRWAKVLIIAGAVITLGSGAAGFLWLNRVPDLRPVTFGEQAQITATGSGGASIYTPTGQQLPPPARQRRRTTGRSC
jgi:hypothetical protein